MEMDHRVAPDTGRNVRCACGAEYSQVANLMRHIDRENRPKVGAAGLDRRTYRVAAGWPSPLVPKVNDPWADDRDVQKQAAHDRWAEDAS